MRETIFLIALASANSGIAMRIVEPMLPRLATDFGVSVSIASAVITGYALAYAGAQLAYGALGDRFGKVRVVTYGLIGAALATFGCALAWDVTSLAIMRFATGMFASSAVMLGMAYIGDQVALAERQPVIARFITGTIIGQALGPVVGGTATDWLGWRGTFALLGAVFAAVALVLVVRTRAQWAGQARQGPIGNPFKVFLQIVRISRVRYVLSIGVLETFFFFGAFSFLGAFLKQRFDLSLTLIGMILAGFGVGGVLYTFAVRRLLRLLGQRGMAACGGAVCFGCYAISALTPVWQVVIPCVLGVGFAFFMVHNTIQTKATEMAPQARGSGLSLYTVSWALGQAVGVAAMGVAVSVVGYAPAIIAFGAGFLVLALWLRANLDRL